MESPYDVLSVDPDADEAAVRRAYRRRVKEVHPDHDGSREEFQRVRAAYEWILSADGRRGDGDGIGRQEGGRAAATRVEYLDYEALDDHGWGLDDDGLFEKADEAGLDAADHGRFRVQPGETLLGAAERCGLTWPYSCRGGACANCAVAVAGGDVEMRIDHLLTEELLDRGVRLSCIGTPTTEELQVVFNVKHLPAVEDLLLPPGPFRWARAGD